MKALIIFAVTFVSVGMNAAFPPPYERNQWDTNADSVAVFTNVVKPGPGITFTVGASSVSLNSAASAPYGTNVIGAVLEAYHATNADFATLATHLSNTDSNAILATATNAFVKLKGDTMTGDLALQVLRAVGVQGDGNALSNLNASQVLTGTIADARLSGNVALLNANNVFTGGSNAFTGIVNFLSNTIMSSLTATTATITNAVFVNGISGTNLTAGTVNSNKFDTATLALFGAGGGGGSQTPITSDINYAAVFSPTNFAQAVGVAGNSGAPTFTFNGNRDTGIYFDSSPEIDFSISGTKKVWINRFGQLASINGLILNNEITFGVTGHNVTWTDGNGAGPYLLPSIQAGHTNVTTATSVFVSFSVPMQSTNYTAVCTADGAALAGYFPSGKLVGGFTANFTSITSSDIDWQVIQHTQ